MSPSENGARPDDEKRNQAEADKDLEKSLKDTFPASDPPSQTTPGDAVGWEEPGGDKKK